MVLVMDLPGRLRGEPLVAHRAFEPLVGDVLAANVVLHVQPASARRLVTADHAQEATRACFHIEAGDLTSPSSLVL